MPTVILPNISYSSSFQTIFCGTVRFHNTSLGFHKDWGNGGVGQKAGHCHCWVGLPCPAPCQLIKPVKPGVGIPWQKGYEKVPWFRKFENHWLRSYHVLIVICNFTLRTCILVSHQKRDYRKVHATLTLFSWKRLWPRFLGNAFKNMHMHALIQIPNFSAWTDKSSISLQRDVSTFWYAWNQGRWYCALISLQLILKKEILDWGG